MLLLFYVYVIIITLLNYNYKKNFGVTILIEFLIVTKLEFVQKFL